MANVQFDATAPSISEPIATASVAVAAAVAAPTTMSAAAVASPAALLMIARQVGEGLKTKSAGLDYHIDIVGGMPRIRIIDTQTMQIIRQIPSDEVLTIHTALDRPEGVLLNQKV
jgi:flagellar protein FlaG